MLPHCTAYCPSALAPASWNARKGCYRRKSLASPSFARPSRQYLRSAVLIFLQATQALAAPRFQGTLSPRPIFFSLPCSQITLLLSLTRSPPPPRFHFYLASPPQHPRVFDRFLPLFSFNPSNRLGRPTNTPRFPLHSIQNGQQYTSRFAAALSVASSPGFNVVSLSSGFIS